jgi:hypothetical protein
MWPRRCRRGVGGDRAVDTAPGWGWRRGRALTAEGCFRGGGGGAAGAQSLWDALAWARADYAPRVLAEAEDAVFRWYLPVARSLATGPAVIAVDPVAVEQAAELGLAQAVLGWRRPDCGDFERFARGVIIERLQRFPAARGTGRLTLVPPAVSPLLGRDDDVAPGGVPL